jgi:hypothetical protein
MSVLTPINGFELEHSEFRLWLKLLTHNYVLWYLWLVAGKPMVHDIIMTSWIIMSSSWPWYYFLLYIYANLATQYANIHCWVEGGFKILWEIQVSVVEWWWGSAAARAVGQTTCRIWQHKCVDTVLVGAIWKEKDAVGIGYRDADTARPAGNMRRNIRSCAICLRLRLRTYSHKCLRPACIFFTFDWHWTWRRAPRALLYLAFGVPYYIRYSLAVNLIETYWQVLPALHAAHILPRDSDLGPFGLSVSLHFNFNGFSFL